MKAVWEKVFEYASMPVHGSLSRKLRKGIRVQVNEEKTYVEATLFLGEEFLRISEEDGASEAVNTYYDWKMAFSYPTFAGRFALEKCIHLKTREAFREISTDRNDGK